MLSVSSRQTMQRLATVASVAAAVPVAHRIATLASASASQRMPLTTTTTSSLPIVSKRLSSLSSSSSSTPSSSPSSSSLFFHSKSASLRFPFVSLPHPQYVLFDAPHHRAAFARLFSTDSSTSASSPPSSSASSSSSSTSPATPSTAPPPSTWTKIKQKVVAEAKHYWLGTKLLVADVRVAAKLVRQVLNGHELTRRERKQLTRTSADLLRLIPFAVIVIVPFMEFSLPILLKLFPNMLPSTYLDHKGEEAKLQKELAAKIEVAQFLQETTNFMADQVLDKRRVELALMNELKQHADSSISSPAVPVPSRSSTPTSSSSSTSPSSSASAPSAAISSTTSTTTTTTNDAAAVQQNYAVAKNFAEFMAKVRRGESVTNAEILRSSSLFDDEFTLEHLSHAQLAAMCRLLDIRVFGSDWVLRYKITKKLNKIREDDRMIKKEGVNSLTLEELREACRARGIHPGHTLVYMRRKMNDWLELSLNHDVPTSLLVLSRAFSSAMTFKPKIELASTLKYIPDVVVEDAQQNEIDRTGDVEEKLRLLHKVEEQKTESSGSGVESGVGGGVGASVGIGAGGRHAAVKPKKSSGAVIGLPDVKERLQEIALDNDEVEEDIDEVQDAVLAKKQKKRRGEEEDRVVASESAVAATTSMRSADARVSSATPVDSADNMKKAKPADASSADAAAAAATDAARKVSASASSSSSPSTSSPASAEKPIVVPELSDLGAADSVHEEDDAHPHTHEMKAVDILNDRVEELLRGIQQDIQKIEQIAADGNNTSDGASPAADADAPPSSKVAPKP